MTEPTQAPAQASPTAEAQATAAASPAADTTVTPAPSDKAAPAAAEPRKTALSGAETAKPAATDDPNAKQPSDSAKAADSKDGEGQDKDKADGAPETYEPFKLPENMEIDATVLGKFTEMAKEANMSQERAQAFTDMGAELVTEAVESFYQSQVADYAAKVDGWNKARAADPDIGGTEEAQIKALGDTLKVVRAIGGEDLVKALDETGAGDNPAIIKAFWKLKTLVGEDGKLISGNLGGNNEPKSAAQGIYPNLPSKQT